MGNTAKASHRARGIALWGVLVLFAGCGPKEAPNGTAAASGTRPEPSAVKDGAVLAPVAPGGVLAALLGEPPPGTGAPVASVRATSRVHYISAPDRPHQLTATFLGAERARVELRLPAGTTGERLIETRRAGRVGRFDFGGKLWSELAGPERADALRRLALRRAALLFPDGVEWEPGTPRADGREGIEYRAQPEPEVVLRATLDGQAGLERVAVFDGAGREQEALLVRTTTTIGDRLWPRDMELEIGGVRVWQETVLGVQLGVQFVDSYFAPEGEQRGGRNRDVHGVLVDLPRSFVLRRELEPAERGWAAARARAVVWLAEAEERAQRGGPVVDPRPTFELDGDGRPVAVLLRQVGGTGGEGFVERPGGRGVSLLAEDLESLGAREFALLAAAAEGAPTWQPAGPVEARELGLPGSEGDRRVQLVLPLAPREGSGE